MSAHAQRRVRGHGGRHSQFLLIYFLSLYSFLATEEEIRKGQEAQAKLRNLENLLHLKSTQGTSLETLLLAEGIPVPPSVNQEEYSVFDEELPSTSTGTFTKHGRSGEMSTERSTVDLLQSTVDGRHSTVDSRHATEEHDHQSTDCRQSTVDRSIYPEEVINLLRRLSTG